MEIRIHIEEFSSSEKLPETDQRLVTEAIKAISSAYAPYSGFSVGAAVLLANGAIITGNNQENAAYPSGVCAERVAISYASASYPDQKIKTIAIAAFLDKQPSKEPVPPCGFCRQVMIETEIKQDSPLRVILYGKNQIQIIENARQLLPLYFDGSILRED